MIQTHLNLMDRVSFSRATHSAPTSAGVPRDEVILGQRPAPEATLLMAPPVAEVPLPTLRGERELQRLAKLAEVRGYTDGLGLGLDEGIVDTVAALQLNGFQTSASCEGHVDWGCGAPWVDVQAAHEPPGLFPEFPNAIHIISRYNGQRQVFEEVARENGLSVDQMLDRGQDSYLANRGLHVEAHDRAYSRGETPEFQAWVASNEALRTRFEELVGAYNARNSEVDRISIDRLAMGTFRVYAGSKADLDRDFKSQSEADKAALAERLVASRQSMQKFADFLTERFLTSTDPNR